MSRQTILRISLSLALSILAINASAAQPKPPTVEDFCTKSTWANCGAAVKKEIDALPNPLPADKVKRLVEIMGLWSDAYEKQVRELDAAGRLKRSESDWTKITSVVTDQINPVEIAKEKGIDALLKKYLPKVAAFLDYAKPVFGPLSAFFTGFSSSEIASDFDELNLINQDLQDRFLRKMEPHLRSDWKARIEAMSKEVMPQIRAH